MSEVPYLVGLCRVPFAVVVSGRGHRVCSVNGPDRGRLLQNSARDDDVNIRKREHVTREDNHVVCACARRTRALIS